MCPVNMNNTLHVLAGMASRSPELVRALKSQKARKLFEHLYELPNYGVGRKFTRVIWKDEHNSYWQITRVKPDQVGVAHAIKCKHPNVPHQVN